MARRHFTELTSSTFSAAEHRGESFAPHSHETDQLFWFPDGGMDAEVGDSRWLVHSDSILWIPAGVVHSNRLLGPGLTLSLYLDPRLRPGGDRWTRPQVIVAEPLLGALMRHLPGRAPGPRRREACYLLLVDLLSEAEEREMSMPLPTHPLAKTVARTLLADPGDSTELRKWASRLHVSERTIARAFAAETGHGFSAWRARVRLLAALPLLLEGLPVHTVGTRVGYGSVGGFIAAFTKEFGTTPKRYVQARR